MSIIKNLQLKGGYSIGHQEEKQVPMKIKTLDILCAEKYNFPNKGFKGIRMDAAEERFNELENQVKELSKQTSRKERMREKLRDMENKSKTVPICIIGISKGVK